MSDVKLVRVNAHMPEKLVALAKEYGSKRGITLTELMRTALKKHMVELIRETETLPEGMKNV